MSRKSKDQIKKRWQSCRQLLLTLMVCTHRKFLVLHSTTRRPEGYFFNSVISGISRLKVTVFGSEDLMALICW